MKNTGFCQKLMKKFLPGILTICVACFSGCAAQTKLPPEMPADVKMSFASNGGMSPYYTQIEIDGNTLRFKERLPAKNKVENVAWTAKLQPADKADLYKLFVENKIDQITNETNKSITYDAGSEGVGISFAPNVFYNVQAGANFPLSAKNKLRYQNIAAGFGKLAEKYKAMADKSGENADENQTAADYSDKIAVINFDAVNHERIFKDGKPANLSNAEVSAILLIIKKEIESYNSKKSAKINFDEYKFQLIAVSDDKNRKQIWVNAFCNDALQDWRKNIVMAKDGGQCYWQMYINLGNKTSYGFTMNGSA